MSINKVDRDKDAEQSAIGCVFLLGIALLFAAINAMPASTLGKLVVGMLLVAVAHRQIKMCN